MEKRKVSWFHYIHFHPTGSRWKLRIRLICLVVGTIGVITGSYLLYNQHPIGATICYIGAGGYIANIIFNSKRLYQKLVDAAVDFLN
jgi:hypothetical protein